MSLIACGRRWWTFIDWRKGDEEGRVTVELSDFERHDVCADVGTVVKVLRSVGSTASLREPFLRR